MGILNMLSPSIQVNEVDLTAIVPGASVSTGAFVGEFNWGPCDAPVLVSSESDLVSRFSTPTTSASDFFVATSFFSCANFLSYTNSLYVVRQINTANAKNASDANTKPLILNEAVYSDTWLANTWSGNYGSFCAKYPGSIGSGLVVSLCTDANSFSSWTYSSYFDNAPGTSSFALEKSGGVTSNDEMHIVVVDADGKFTNKSGTVLERFEYVSKAIDAMDVNGRSGYYKNVLMNNSSYVLALDPPVFANTSNTWGTSVTDTSSFAGIGAVNITLSGGADGDPIAASNLINGWSHFINKDQYEISLAFVGASADLPDGITVPQYVLDNVILGTVSETPTIGRRDTMLFISPMLSDVKQQRGYEVSNIVSGLGSFLSQFNRDSSYVVVDSGWKYQYDRYNNIYRWVPLNADIAGLCAYTDNVAETWYSPAGYTRGKIKNVVKLAWSPNQAERDALYSKGVNPVISMVGEGIILLGDKTLQAKPSAFDRINVRRLFIILEKSISRFAKYSMFEFNDAFTRAQFVAAVEPYLRTVQARRGIYDFKVICDESNNTPDIIDRNGFVGDIYIKPARSINFIQLNFVAVKTGVEFNTVVGKF